MADCNYVLEGWEWENIFPSSVLEHDLAWHGELLVLDSMNAAATPSPASIHPSSSTFTGNTMNSQHSLPPTEDAEGYGTPIASSGAIAANASDGSLESSAYDQHAPSSTHHFPSSETSPINPSLPKKKKKRDPRLECPNFLAGRIPCSCPEEDELDADVEAEAVLTKRSRVAARCQVPSCGEDISHLKGYHQRHRVCLRCANSPKVILKGQAHRYCQQCGKFHRLADFDEGKRSCRMKLEIHNRLRRRRPVEEEASMQDGGTPPIDCSEVHPSAKGVAVRKVQTSAASVAQIQGTKAVGASQKKKGPLSRGERNPAASIVRSSDISPSDALQRKEAEGITQDFTTTVRDDQRGSDDSSGSVRRFEEDIISSSEGKLDDDCLLDVPLVSANEQTEQVSRNTKHSLKSEAPLTAHVLTNGWKCTDYVSPCPTGRISFKLYDWNPADFPRRLRQQIFEWLASMPVELESYVRSGCIILTFFVAMPQLMWDKVLAEWKGQVQAFILKSGVKLLGTGRLSMQMAEKSLCWENGMATSACHKDLLAPFIVDLQPRSLEAGCRTQIYVFGFNFFKGRFLLSFGGQYVECSDWEAVENSQFAARKLWNGFGNIEVQKVTVCLPDMQKFGLAYVEVENAHGLSNFMPVLVADKSTCSEINMMELNYSSSIAFYTWVNTHDENAKTLRLQSHMDLLTDLGWTLKYMNENHRVDNVEVREALIWRLQTLLIFFLEHRCHVIVHHLVQIAFSKFATQNLYSIPGLQPWNISSTVKDLKAISFNVHNQTAVKDHVACVLTAGEVDNTRAICKANENKGLQETKSAIEQWPLMHRNTIVEDSCKGCFSPMEEPLLEERIPISEDEWRHKACWAWSSSWPRKPLGVGTTILRTGNRKFTRILVTAVGVVTVCTGMCLMLRHPHEVSEFSMSLRRCLWGSTGMKHV